MADDIDSMENSYGYQSDAGSTGELGTRGEPEVEPIFSDIDEDALPVYGYEEQVEQPQESPAAVPAAPKASVQQTLTKAGGAAAGAMRNAGAAMSEGFSAMKNVATAAREHSSAKSRMREMELALEQDSAFLEHRLSIERDYDRIVGAETAELQDAQGIVASTTATIESLSAERDGLNNQLASLKASNEQMLRPYRTLVESTRNRADDTSRILGDARRAVKDVESQVEEASRRREQTIASANRALDSAQERLRKVQEDLKALQDDPGSALSAIFDLKGEVAQETASVEAARVEVQNATTDSQFIVDNAQQQLFTLRTSLETAESDYETAKNEAEERRGEYDRLHKDCLQKEQALEREIDVRLAGIEDAQDAMRAAEERIKEAQGLLDEANEIHSTPEITEQLLASVNQQRAQIEQQRAIIHDLATSEKSLRESTRGKRIMFIGVIAAAVVLAIVILWLIFGPK